MSKSRMVTMRLNDVDQFWVRQVQKVVGAKSLAQIMRYALAYTAAAEVKDPEKWAEAKALVERVEKTIAIYTKRKEPVEADEGSPEGR